MLDQGVRDQVSKLQGLVVLSTLLAESRDEVRIMEMIASTVPSLARVRLGGIHLVGRGWMETGSSYDDPAVRADLEAQFVALSRAGGPVAIIGDPWGWAFPLRVLDDHVGHIVVGADAEPPPEEQFLLRALAQQTGIALANARLHTRERLATAKLRTANAALADTVRALDRSTAVHERLHQVAVAGGGPSAVARTVHQYTGLPVAVEDRHGNLQAWVGPDRPDPYPKDPPGQRDQILEHARRERRPVRSGERLLAAATRDEEILGVLALVDPTARAGVEDEVALSHGATVLTIELGRRRDLAESELRLGRDLADKLVTGTDDDSAFAHAQALDYDLSRPHHVVVIESLNGIDDQRFFHAVRRAARDTGVGSLLVGRDGAVVVLADTAGALGGDPPWERLRKAVVDEPGGGPCRVGVGATCERPADFPRSHREARAALRLQALSGGPDRAVAFDDLGVYRLFADAPQAAGVERFVREWLGPLVDYDAENGSGLVDTLSSYLECGGNYDATARQLDVHRSTIKYRLRRIREIGRRDLANPDTQFHLQLATRARRTLNALRGL
jgi:sugar diacid utilization regulator